MRYITLTLLLTITWAHNACTSTSLTNEHQSEQKELQIDIKDANTRIESKQNEQHSELFPKDQTKLDKSTPSTEKCNGKDDNGNGIIDENAYCPVGTLCYQGNCFLECNTQLCPNNVTCREIENNNSVCIVQCTENSECPQSLSCINSICNDPCTQVTCTGKYEECKAGKCIVNKDKLEAAKIMEQSCEQLQNNWVSYLSEKQSCQTSDDCALVTSYGCGCEMHESGIVVNKINKATIKLYLNRILECNIKIKQCNHDMGSLIAATCKTGVCIPEHVKRCN